MITHPASLETNPRLAQWLRFEADGSVTVTTGKVEIGQGILTSLALIVADELDVPLDRVRVAAASTARGANEAVTSGSLSIQHSGNALRQVCAEVRRIALEKARATVADGVPDYWRVLVPQDLEVQVSGSAKPKAVEQLKLVGRDTARVDLPDKVFGVPRFIHDLKLPGMLHGRIVRPPSPAATLKSCSDDTAVVDGSFVAVVAPTEAEADKAAARVRDACTWHESPTLPDARALDAFLVTSPATAATVHAKGEVQGAAHSHAADYFKPYIAHASIGPSCAIARFADGKLEVWTHSQGIHNLRDDLALALPQIPKDAITIQHVEGAGCYGHNGADDVAFDAVLLALQRPGRPVRVLWSRADELAWSPLGGAQRVRIEAGTDGTGRIVNWRHTVWANGASSRPGRAKIPTLLANAHRAGGAPLPVSVNPALAAGGGADRNAIPPYAFAHTQVVNHRLDVMPLRTSALRSLGAFGNVFACESLMDEIAHAQGADPFEFRLRHLEDERGRAVLQKVVSASRWWNTAKPQHVGHGLAVARYKSANGWCAVAARVDASALLRVLELDIAVDVGRVVHPDGVVNQVEGGALQSVSWTLKEQVAFDSTRIMSDSWGSYPILRFSEVPRVNVFLMDRPELPSEGAGELAQGPVAAAIANALFDAIGARVRRLPLTAENIAAA